MQRRTLLQYALLLGLAPHLAQAQAPLRVLTMGDVEEDYQHFIAGKNPQDIRYFGGHDARRDVAELVLLHQALAIGGYSVPLQLFSYKTDGRLLKDLSLGHGDCSGSSLWRSEALHYGKKLALSRTLIDNGRFEAGLYTLADHPALQHRPSLADLRRMTAVCARSWQPDIDTLRSLRLPRILLTESWPSMLGMLQKGRADFLLAPFQPTADLSFQAQGSRFKPLPGIKVGLAGTRHFVMNRAMAERSGLLQALNRGLEILEKEGRIEQAYREAGFYDERVRGWKKLPG